MLFYYLDSICKGALAIVFIIILCVTYTFVANLYRDAKDPKKRDYHPLAIILAPLSLPLFLTLGIIVFVLRAVLFAGFISVFALLLIAVRKPFLFEWWHKFATKIGDPLLKLNTYLIRAAFGQWNASSLSNN